MRQGATTTRGGGIHPSAVIGSPPEDRRAGDSAGHAPAIHVDARVEAFVSVDAGLDRPTRVGARAWLMKHCHVGHDVHIGHDCELAPGVIVGGFAHIEPEAKIGMGAVILPYRVVGHGATVGAGAVVTASVPPGATVVGSPARILFDGQRNQARFSDRPSRERGVKHRAESSQ